MEKDKFKNIWAKLQPRVVASPCTNLVRKEIRDIPTSTEVIEHMSRKCEGYAVLLNDISAPQAHILKETMLSLDGDAAVHRQLIKTPIDSSQVVILGTKRQLDSLSAKMQNQPFALTQVAECVKKAIANFNKQIFTLKLRDNKSFLIDKPLIMGVLNVTTDSFSDGGKYLKIGEAISRSMQMIEQGADIIDIGGESSRPGAKPISETDELRNILPIIEKIRDKSDVLISVDTYKPEVARKAVDAGCNIINDITGARNPELVEVAAQTQAAFIVMHMQGNPQNMQRNPEYDHVIAEIYTYLFKANLMLQDAGISADSIIHDVGFGFGKTPQHNLTLLKYLHQFRTIGSPLMVGLSRKSLFKFITGAEVDDRLIETIAAHYHCLNQGAKILRVHDVSEAVKAKKVFEAIENVQIS
ncbi:MAG: dihydropteroate synthase [Planctomycetes bacterium]|nr:dihydropteroate synthase [Planctomycetota bacterium]